MAKDCFTIKQAANFLKVTDSVIKEMIKSKVFKAKKKGNVYQIEKAEVEEWLANLNEREVEQLALKRSVCRFSDYFKARYIFLDFYADNKYEAIAEMSKDNQPVRLFFMLLLHNDAQHLFSISYISKLLMNEANLKVLRSTSSTEEIERALTKNVLR
jgi:excisionase family DNA binding protein